MTKSKAQIVCTIGPASGRFEVLFEMVAHQMDIARLNFSWPDFKTRVEQIGMIRTIEKNCGRKIPIIEDLPGPRIQKADGHTYDKEALSSLTEQDRNSIAFGVEKGIDYVALSFVGGAKDVILCREAIKQCGGKQLIIAKIERLVAVEFLDEIIKVSDAIMVARGDLGNEIPLEKIPFVQADIIQRAKKAGKPVITATQMLLSMVENPTPTRAEVTDVANAILQGSDAVMLSEETAMGKYPVEALLMMEKIVVEAERHMAGHGRINSL